MSIQRLYVFCEGQTEEAFTNATLYPHFFNRNRTSVIPILLPSKRGISSRAYKGGWTDYAKAKTFIQNFMAGYHSEETWFTTLLDLYAIPENFPGLAETTMNDANQRISALEANFASDTKTNDLWRFSPHLQLHEFEALLLSVPEEIKSSFPNRKDEIDDLIAEIGALQPEHINHGRDTAPSKRIIKFVPEYEGQKASTGPIIAHRIGLERLRDKCPHFDAWLTEIEAEIDESQ
jgi:hypothetical protein